MASKLGATFVPGSDDDYFMPEVVAPSPQRVTPQVPQNMQEDLQRMELEAREVHDYNRSREPSLSTYTGQKPDPRGYGQSPSQIQSQSQTRTRLPDMDEDAPSFSPFPKVVGDNVPPADDEKENILWKARNHVLHSQNVNMQITWARDVLNWAEISMDAAVREAAETGNRPPTPRKEHELRNDAVNIIRYLAEQEHPDALYIRAKWLEFGKFGERVDKREAYSGYKKASDLGSTRSVYRMGMLFEQSNDMSKAKEYYYKGLSLKDSAALYRMGMMSLLGQHGETKDYHGGLERIRAAADSADEDAPQGAYVYGMLIGRDLPDISIPEGMLPYAIDTAKVYVEKAAYLGFAKAQLKMGQAYELCQLGCDFNPSYSLHYYGLAARQGIPEAALGVSRWFLFGYEGVFKKNEELAFKYAHEAASAKLPTGEFAMGYYHEIGIHVNKDVVEAQRWYQLAADHGNKDAVGRLESLSQGGGLSKQDHETTTLGRIKSQHGSMRGKRPDRFKQNNPMPTLSEGDGPAPLPKLVTAVGNSRVSPLPSPGMRPTIVTENNSFAEPSRASFVDTADRQPAFNIRVDPNAPPMRSQSAAPYPVDDRMQPPRNAPYPDDDGRPRLNNNYPPNQGPSADRPGSAFGVRPQGNGAPQPGGNLYPSGPPGAGRGRGGPPGPGQGPGGYGPPGGGPGQGRPYPGDSRPGSAHSGNRMQNKPPQGYGGPGGPMMGGPHGGPEPGQFAPRTSSRQDGHPGGGPGPPPGHGPSPGPQGPGNGPRPGPSRVGTAPPGPSPHHSSSPAPGPGPGPASPPAKAKPAGKQGPATFEDMGIPQGKQDGDCVVM
ncbi:chitin synthase activator [Trichoderma virens Gv29-8]|uniref:Chitin synthase activator n=1 Tax=Hypocrea virens (strain Gv29-8 / FGSC 10586) TaxID=413071 RepID=G9N1U0_HYPVG|nr:chitin synthase activator [Trichoderma virens Gv29-8]EHK19057.1 chitin synthase activator [Trichoderma virens Gv29-8]